MAEKTILGFPNDRAGRITQFIFLCFAVPYLLMVAYQSWCPASFRCSERGGRYYIFNNPEQKCQREIVTHQYLDIGEK